MNRQEFLDTLKECLTDEVSQSEITDALNYYNEYISEEERNGRTESEVLTSLGSPRLIAHSIIDAHEEAENGATSAYYDAEDDSYEQDRGISTSDKIRAFAIKTVVAAVIIAIIVIAIFVLNALLPFILLAVVFGWLYRMFKNRQ